MSRSLSCLDTATNIPVMDIAIMDMTGIGIATTMVMIAGMITTTIDETTTVTTVAMIVADGEAIAVNH